MSDTKQCEFCEKDMERGKRPFHLECYGEARSIFQNYSAMLAENAALVKEREELREKLNYAQDDLKHWENACWACADPANYGDPEQHDHEPDGPHWHHYLDPGDGLPSPCENSALLNRVMATVTADRDRLQIIVDSLKDVAALHEKGERDNEQLQQLRDSMEVTLRGAMKEVDQLTADRDRLQQELSLQLEMIAALKWTVVVTIGGKDDEGNPTSEINYLQRLRRLVENEKQVAGLQQELETVRKAAAKLLAPLDKFGDWDDGCFYYNHISATELETPILELRERLAPPQEKP